MILLHKKCESRFIVNQGQTIFSQVIDFLPWEKLRQCINRYNSNHRIRSFTYYKREFSLENIAKKYLQLYRQIMGQ